MMSLLRKYFLRIYAIERHNGEKDDLACCREALFRTRLLALLPPMGVVSSAIVIAGRLSSAHSMLAQYRPAITVIGIVCMFLVSFAAVRQAIAKIANIPAMAAQHASERDRLMSHVTFFCTLFLSLALPFIVALILPGPSSR